MTMALLEVDNLTATYGASQALFGMSFTAEAGQCVTLIGIWIAALRAWRRD